MVDEVMCVKAAEGQPINGVVWCGFAGSLIPTVALQTDKQQFTHTETVTQGMY